MNIQLERQNQLFKSQQLEKAAFITIGSGVALAASHYVAPGAVKSIFEYAISNPLIYNATTFGLETILKTGIFSLIINYFDGEKILERNSSFALGLSLTIFTYKDYGPLILDVLNSLIEITSSYYFRILAIIVSSIIITGYLLSKFVPWMINFIVLEGVKVVMAEVMKNIIGGAVLAPVVLMAVAFKAQAEAKKKY